MRQNIMHMSLKSKFAIKPYAKNFMELKVGTS